MRNMKIEVENNLGEIVFELERLGYKWSIKSNHSKATDVILTFSDGLFDYFYGGYRRYDLTTLAELKEMKNAK